MTSILFIYNYTDIPQGKNSIVVEKIIIHMCESFQTTINAAWQIVNLQL